ncbi:hypothetical protein LTR08_002221 [Meristemomyces frigidus]|nr:hypothetical protein LTR08_002221 [Meristemomyces frigidus]
MLIDTLEVAIELAACQGHADGACIPTNSDRVKRARAEADKAKEADPSLDDEEEAVVDQTQVDYEYSPGNETSIDPALTVQGYSTHRRKDDEEVPDARFYEYDTDTADDITQEFGARQMPTFNLLKNGDIRGGAKAEALEKLIKENYNGNVVETT